MTMAGEHLSGNGYSPLPQSISNTDTEDEDEHLTRPNHFVQRESHDTMMDSLHRNCRFLPLDETQKVENRMQNGRTSLGYCSDNIPIMVLDGEAHDLWKRHDMTSLRRVCLVFSILLCILTTLIFLYVLPCDNSVICPEIAEPKSSLSWEKTLEGVELQGPISIISGAPSTLIFLLRGQRFGNTNSKPSGQAIPAEGGGVLSMQGTNGIPLWWVILKRVPRDINCYILDTDKSGKSDCIVVGEQGLLDSIEPTTGMIHWRSTIHTSPDLPVLLPDIDSDGINDLLSVLFNGEPNLKLVLISGKSGNLLGTYSLPECQVVKLDSLNSNYSIPYLCRSTNGKETMESVSLGNLLSSVNLSAAQRKLALAPKTSFKNALPSNQKTSSWNLNPIYRLHVENQGICPGEQCQVRLNITIQNMSNDTREIWHHSSSNSFASIPAIFNSTDELYSAGFALKLWHWPTKDVEKPTPSDTDNFKQTLTERVLIIFMNHTEFRMINASENEITQFCNKGDCQPSLEMQTKSIAIVDFDGDGTSELISYQSSYDVEEPGLLTSKIQVVKLDTVL